MANLYDVDVRTINYHIKKIFRDSELQRMEKNYNTNHYSLEMIIAVGFKVNSERAVQFRKWVNQIAKDYTIKGWISFLCQILISICWNLKKKQRVQCQMDKLLMREGI